MSYIRTKPCPECQSDIRTDRMGRHRTLQHKSLVQCGCGCFIRRDRIAVHNKKAHGVAVATQLKKRLVQCSQCHNLINASRYQVHLRTQHNTTTDRDPAAFALYHQLTSAILIDGASVVRTDNLSTGLTALVSIVEHMLDNDTRFHCVFDSSISNSTLQSSLPVARELEQLIWEFPTHFCYLKSPPGQRLDRLEMTSTQ